MKELKFDQSVNAYTEALTLDPFNKKLNSILYSNRAVALMKQKKYKEALEDCDRSIE